MKDGGWALLGAAEDEEKAQAQSDGSDAWRHSNPPSGYEMFRDVLAGNCRY
jgi:hypothetical protein